MICKRCKPMIEKAIRELEKQKSKYDKLALKAGRQEYWQTAKNFQEESNAVRLKIEALSELSPTIGNKND